MKINKTRRAAPFSAGRKAFRNMIESRYETRSSAGNKIETMIVRKTSKQI